MNRWPLPDFVGNSTSPERNFVYNFDPEDDPEFSDENRIIRPVFRNGDLDPGRNNPNKQQLADLAKSYSFHGDGAALVPSYVVTVSLFYFNPCTIPPLVKLLAYVL